MELQKNEKIFESNSGANKIPTNVIYEAIYHDSPCYVIEHTPSGWMAVIDHNEQVLKAIKDKIDRTHALVLDKKRKGLHLLKWQRYRREKSISLRLYVYAKYHEIKLNISRGKNIQLYDSSAGSDRVIDLRRANLYDAGECRPHTKVRDIDIIERPSRPDEKFIRVTIHGKNVDRTEYVEYEPELFEMLARPTYCSIKLNKREDRSTVIVHYGHSKAEYTLNNLEKFLLIYRLHFDAYRKRKGAIKLFISEYNKLRKQYPSDKVDAAHVNSCSWSHYNGNLIFMSKITNIQMTNYIKYFVGAYRAYTAVNDAGEILVEITKADPIHGGEPVTLYYKCETPEAYLDLQKFLLGKDKLTEDLKIIATHTDDGAGCEFTPCGMITEGVVTSERVKANEPDFWTQLEHKDKLLQMDTEGRIPYIWKEGKQAGVMLEALGRILTALNAPAGNVIVNITPVEMPPEA